MNLTNIAEENATVVETGNYTDVSYNHIETEELRSIMGRFYSAVSWRNQGEPIKK